MNKTEVMSSKSWNNQLEGGNFPDTTSFLVDMRWNNLNVKFFCVVPYILVSHRLLKAQHMEKKMTKKFKTRRDRGQKRVILANYSHLNLWYTLRKTA